MTQYRRWGELETKEIYFSWLEVQAPSRFHIWREPASWLIHSCLFAVSSHGKRDEGASWSLWQGHYSHSWGFHSCDQSLLKAHILILSHWGLGFRHIHWGGGHKHSVYSRQHPTHSSKAPEILSLEVNIPFFWMSLSFIFRGWLAPI